MMCRHQVDTMWLVFEKHRAPKASFFSQSVMFQECVQNLWMPQTMDKLQPQGYSMEVCSSCGFKTRYLQCSFAIHIYFLNICAGMDLLIGKQIWQYGCVAVTQRSAQTGFFEMEQICKWTCVCNTKRQWLISLSRLFLLGPALKSLVKACLHNLIHESIRRM